MRWFLRLFSAPVMMLAAPLLLTSAAHSAESAPRSENHAVDLFVARNDRQIAVRLIPHDAKTGTVIITNLTKEPLTIKLPEAFAGIPILAQRGVGAAELIGGNNRESGGISQGLGGGFGGGVGGGGLGGGGGFFNIGPERVAKIKIASVCLEHGKADPSRRIPYEIIPIEQFTANASVSEVVKLLGRGVIGQPEAQAAAWHLANGLSWQQLSNKVGIRHLNGTSEPFFSARELERAMRVADEASRRAGLYDRSTYSPGETLLSIGN